jgi:hypothetical protein
VPLNPGALTVTFSPPGRFSVDRLHTVPASSGLSEFSQSGVAVQPITVKDKVDDTTYAEATDRAITLFNTNTATVTAEWYMTLNSANYRVLGTRNVADAWGVTYQCEFILKEEDLGQV